MSKLIITLLLISFAIQAQATECGKWKFEIAGAIVQAGFYASAYADYHNNKINRDEFFSKAHNIVAKIKLIQERTEKIQSCLGDSAYEQ